MNGHKGRVKDWSRTGEETAVDAHTLRAVLAVSGIALTTDSCRAHPTTRVFLDLLVKLVNEGITTAVHFNRVRGRGVNTQDVAVIVWR